MHATIKAALSELVGTLPDPILLSRIDQRLDELIQATPRPLTLQEIASSDRVKLEALCRMQVQSLYLGDHAAVCRSLSRYKLLLDTRDRGFVTNVLLDGYWEMWLTIFMCRRVKPGMVVIDVGANFGYYTLLLADLVGPQGHAFAIEPNPLAAALLRQSVALNGFGSRTSIVEAAAGAASDEWVLLYTPRNELKNSRIVESPNAVDSSAGIVQEVRQIRIDDVVSTMPRLDFLKIDAEGAEEAIIEGMPASLEKHRPSLVLEFNAGRCKNSEALIHRLISLYSTVYYLGNNSDLIQTTKDDLISHRVGEDWLLFFDRESAVL
jgi:FkbM family methyltransferase